MRKPCFVVLKLVVEGGPQVERVAQGGAGQQGGAAQGKHRFANQIAGTGVQDSSLIAVNGEAQLPVIVIVVRFEVRHFRDAFDVGDAVAVALFGERRRAVFLSDPLSLLAALVGGGVARCQPRVLLDQESELARHFFEFVCQALRAKLRVAFGGNKIEGAFEGGTGQQYDGIRFTICHQQQCGLGQLVNVQAVTEQKICEVGFGHHLAGRFSGSVMNAPEKFLLLGQERADFDGVGFRVHKSRATSFA